MMHGVETSSSLQGINSLQNVWMHSNKTPAETMAAHKAECNYIHFTNKRAKKKKTN